MDKIGESPQRGGAKGYEVDSELLVANLLDWTLNPEKERENKTPDVMHEVVRQVSEF